MPLRSQILSLERRLERERRARKEAEELLESKSRELYENASQLKSANKQLQDIAYRDPITQLPNRLVLEEALSIITGSNGAEKGYGCLYHIDLNDFNAFEGRLGHAAGDELLRQVADRIRAAVPPECIVARLGGDEFAILDIGRASNGRAEMTGRRVSDALAAPYELSHGSFFCSASCGIAIIRPTTDLSAAQCFADAESALMQARSHNRGSFVIYNEKLRSQQNQRLVSREEIFEALEKGQFEIWLQPQIDLRRRVLTGYEALARWRHPTRGIVGPGEFIPTIEHMGLSLRFGAYILERSIALLDRMRNQQKPLTRVGINIVPAHLIYSDLAGSLEQLLEKYNIPAEYIELEITEGSLLGDPEHAQRILRELRRLGVAIALDDFGTGYSSLAYLRQLPIDRIKIDQSFVRAIPADVEASGVIIAIVQMAKAIEMSVLAEGVETQEQDSLLRCLGVDEGQGYLYSKPFPSHKLLAEDLATADVLELQSAVHNLHGRARIA